VSWLPIVGWAIPDQTQVIRIRLKVALVDVKTGQWDIYVPKVFEDTAYTASLNREQSNLQQVAQLKSKVYKAAVESIIARYMR
jgi:deoxyadenosine/deoxycytidine kinase